MFGVDPENIGEDKMNAGDNEMLMKMMQGLSGNRNW